MGDLSEHFSRYEFACKGLACCGGCAPVSERLLLALEELHHILLLNFKVSVVQLIVDSGFRCLTHNRIVGSLDTSFHVLGMAADIRSLQVGISDLARCARGVVDFGCGGIGVYSSFVHVDVRTTGCARW